MKITTIRHGITDWNYARRVQGSQDIPLNEAGINQAQLLGERLAVEPCDIIYASDLKRAHKTAEIIGAHHPNAPLHTSSNLREIGYGDFEGKVIEDDAMWAKFHAHLEQSAAENSARIHGYLDEVVAGGHENIFIVSHFGTIRSMICYFLKLTPEEGRAYVIGNTAIHTFQRLPSGEFDMILENDTAHLGLV